SCGRAAKQGRIHREGGGHTACPVTQDSRAMNPPHPDLLTLLAGFAAILAAASAIGYVLQWRLSPDGSNAAIENLNDRIRAWWVMVALMGLALIGGRAGGAPVFFCFSFAGAPRGVSAPHTPRAATRAAPGA